MARTRTIKVNSGADSSAPITHPKQGGAKGSVFVVVKAHDGFEKGREIANPNASIAKRMVELGYWKVK